MIKSLHLRNFQKHDSLELTFDPGTNLIVGPNWAGKSTILRGILFALFGVTAIPGGKETVTRSTAASDEGSKTEVNMWFTLAGKELLLQRTTAYATLYSENTPIASGTTSVNSRIVELLGVSKSDFLDTQYAKQKETQSLVDIGATELTRMIERTRGVDLLAKAIPIVKTYKDRAAGKVSALSHIPINPLAEQSDTLEKDLRIAGKEQNHMRRAREGLVSEVENMSKQLSASTKNNVDVNRAEDRVANCATVRDRAYDRAEKARHDMLNCSDHEDHVALTDLAYKVKNYQELEVSLSGAEAKVRQAYHSLSEREWPLEEDVKAAKVAEDLATALSSAARVMAQTKKEEMDSGVCAACGRPFDTFNPAKANADYQEALAAHMRASASADAAREKYEEILGSRKTHLDLQDSHDRWESEVTTIKAKMRELQPDVGYETDFGSLLARAEKAREAEIYNAGLKVSFDSAVEASRLAIEAYNSAARALKRLPEKVDTADQETALVNLHNDLGSLEKEMAVAEERHQAMTSTLQDLRKTRANAVQNNRILAAAETEEDIASQLLVFLRKNREAFMVSIWETILASASSFARDATGGVITDVYREGGAFYFVEGGVPMRASSQASGAQASIIGLGLKLALSTATSGSLGCLLLDEVTADMSEEVSATVTSLLGSTGHQIIAVTHREMDRGGNYNVVHIEG